MFGDELEDCSEIPLEFTRDPAVGEWRQSMVTEPAWAHGTRRMHDVRDTSSAGRPGLCPLSAVKPHRFGRA